MIVILFKCFNCVLQRLALLNTEDTMSFIITLIKAKGKLLFIVAKT